MTRNAMSNDDDPFADYGEQNTPGPVKARMRAAAKRAEREAKKKLERNYLLEEWQKWHQRKRDNLMQSEYGAEAQQLADFIESMKISDADALLTLVNTAPWQDAPDDVRFQALGMIDRAIVYLRETNGMAPFDDGLDDDLTVFQIIREMLSSEHHQSRAERLCGKAKPPLQE